MSSWSNAASSDSVSPSGASPRRRRTSKVPLSRRRAVFEWGVLALLCVSPFVGIVIFGGNRIWNVGPMTAVTLLAGGLFWLRLFGRDLQRVVIPPGGIFFLLFTVYAAGHMVFSSIPYSAKAEWIVVAGYLASLFAWTDLSSRSKRWRVLLGLFFVLVSLVAWYALIQDVRGSNMVLYRERPVYGMRASGTYICPNHFANLLEMTLCMGVALVATRGAGLPLRLIAGYTVLICLPVQAMTLSRSGLLGTVAGLGTVFLLLAWHRSRKLFAAAVAAAPVAGAALLGLIWVLMPAFRERLQGMLPSQMDGSAAGRLAYWRDTLPMILEQPVFGHGAGSYRWIFLHFKTTTEQLWLRFAHNEPLHLLAEYGGVGFLLLTLAFGCFLVSGLRTALRGREEKNRGLAIGFTGSLVAYLVHSLFDYSFHVYANVHVLLLIAGVTFGARFASGELKPLRLSPVQARVTGAVAAMTCLGAMVLALLVSGSHILQLRGEALVREFEDAKGLAAYRWAERLDGSNWEVHTGLGSLYRRQSFWNLDPAMKEQKARQAIESLDIAYALNPWDMEAVMHRGKLRIALGEVDQGLEEIARAAGQVKANGPLQLQYALALKKAGRTEEALRQFKLTQTLLPNNKTVLLNLRRLREELRAPRHTPTAPADG